VRHDVLIDTFSKTIKLLIKNNFICVSCEFAFCFECIRRNRSETGIIRRHIAVTKNIRGIQSIVVLGV